MPGSRENPYHEDMFQLIVEVGWSGMADIGILSWWSDGAGYIPMSGRITNTSFASRWDGDWNGMAGPFIPSFSASVPSFGLVQNSGYPVDPEIAVTSDNWVYFEVDVSGNLDAQETLPVTDAISDPESWDALYLCYVAGAMTPTNIGNKYQNLLINYKRMREDLNPTDPIPFTATLLLGGIPYGTPGTTTWKMKHYKIPETGDYSFALDGTTKEVALTGVAANYETAGEVNQQLVTALNISDNMFREVTGT